MDNKLKYLKLWENFDFEEYDNYEDNYEDGYDTEDYTKNTYSPIEIAEFISQNIELTPNSVFNIYKSPKGLTYTKGSMEYRDEEYEEILSFITMDDVPETMDELIDSVKFQLENK